MSQHALNSANVRQAAGWADEMATALRKLKNGPVFEHETKELTQKVNGAYAAIGRLLGKETV